MLESELGPKAACNFLVGKISEIKQCNIVQSSAHQWWVGKMTMKIMCVGDFELLYSVILVIY